MKTIAAVMLEAEKPLEILDVELEGPKENEVLVEILASGICRSDYNSWVDRTNPVPCVLGHEGAGIVRETGKGVTHVSEGDKVILSWVPACGTCFYCGHSQPQLCDPIIKPLFEGTLMDGTKRFRLNGEEVAQFSLLSTFSQFTVVPARSAVKFTADIPFEQAALIGCGVTTGYGSAVHAAKVQPGEYVGVMGLGGVGLSAVQGAKIAGAAKVVGLDLKASNFEPALKFGADHTFNPIEATTKEEVYALTEGRGFDCVIDTTGSTKACEQAMELIRKGGTVVVAGAFHDEKLELTAPGFHRLGKILRGSFYGDMHPTEGFNELIQHVVDGKLNLRDTVRERINIRDINEAMSVFADPVLTNYGRSVITNW